MSNISFALTSLTATYTDSEGEDEGVDHETHNGAENPSLREEGTGSSQSSSVSPDLEPLTLAKSLSSNRADLDAPSRVQGLVSYVDDTAISDEEGPLLDGVQSPIENGNPSSKSAAPSPENATSIEDQEDQDSFGVIIPPEPPGVCPKEIQEKVTSHFKKIESDGKDMNNFIQQRKAFRNPSIYEKLIHYCKINELGTNYPPEMFDPFKWSKDSYYEELAKVQKTEMDKLEKTRKEKAKIEIVSGTAKRPGTIVSAEEEAKRRKSKWDQVATGATAALKPTQVLLSQPTLTTLTSSATGTKATVISAFGSLPKKRL